MPDEVESVFPTRVVTAFQPTRKLHLGHYFGALKPILDLQNTFPTQIYIFIADYHARSSFERPEQLAALEEDAYEMACQFLALGLDPKRCVFYKQSAIPEVFEIMWLLAGLMPHSHLQRGVKAKSLRERAGTGDVLYPLLMAADIIAVKATRVPAGRDQSQHLEFARNAVRLLNNMLGRPVIPRPEILLGAALVPGIDAIDTFDDEESQASGKMSTTHDNYIPIFGDDENVKNRIGSIKTRSVRRNDPLPEENDTILALYELVAGRAEADKLRNLYRANSIGYDEAKDALSTAFMAYFGDAREKYAYWRNRPAEVNEILSGGSYTAHEEAVKTLAELRDGLRYFG